MELRGRRRAKKPQSGFFRRQYDSTVRGKWEGEVQKRRRNPVEKPGGSQSGGSHPPGGGQPEGAGEARRGSRRKKTAFPCAVQTLRILPRRGCAAKRFSSKKRIPCRSADRVPLRPIPDAVL